MSENRKAKAEAWQAVKFTLFSASAGIIQVVSFKTRGKRVFRMAPLHHHFELGGWKETKVVIVFWTITLLLCILSTFML